MDLKIEQKITGLLFLLALIVYGLTIEPVNSLWDASEYIASSYRMQVGHPMGAPIFAFFSSLFTVFVSVEKVALMTNLMSAVFGAVGVAFLYQITYFFANQIPLQNKDKNTKLLLHGSGIFSALILLFLDTYWFNATESELYAMTTTLTILTLWAGTRWVLAYQDKKTNADRWIIAVFSIIGLSVGVRMVALLVVPVLVFGYYFVKKPLPWTKWEIFKIFGIGIGIIGLVQFVTLPNFPIVADILERFLVNQWGLGFHSGVIVFVLAVLGILFFLIHYGQQKKSRDLYLFSVCALMIFLGYLSYGVILIRASAQLPMNQNKPDTMAAMRSYILRERYGKTPFLYGQAFNAPYALTSSGRQIEWKKKEGFPTYIKGYLVKETGKENFFSEYYQAQAYINEKKLNTTAIPHYKVENYDEVLKQYRNVSFEYHPDWMGFFPRIWNSMDKNTEGYKKWSGYDGISYQEFRQQRAQLLGSNQIEVYRNFIQQGIDMNILKPLKDDKGEYVYEGQNILSAHPRPPKWTEELRYFFSYQWYWMYFRYFLWNYSGRYTNIQGGDHDIYKGQWMTGISFIDQQRLGTQKDLPDFIQKNAGHHYFFFLPFLLGILGAVFHFRKDKKNAFLLGYLFFILGTLFIVFLNMPPDEPREREYVLACSFFPFAIWVGLAPLAIYQWSQEKWNYFIPFLKYFVPTGLFLLVIEAIKKQGFFFSFIWIYVLILIVIIYGIHFFLHQKKYIRGLIIALSVLIFGLPFWMAYQNWADHDRSGRYFARGFGKAYLDSCKPNALLFTQGDNDTFPLWYLQDVEGYRGDIRIANSSLIQADWAVNQLRVAIHQSAPFALSLSAEKYSASLRNYVAIEPEKNPYTEKYKDLRIHAKDALRFIDMDKLMSDVGYGFSDAILPTRKVYIKVNKENALKAGIITEQELKITPDTLAWDLEGDFLSKGGLAFLDILANYEWDRPIYFNSSNDLLGQHNGLKMYLRPEKINYLLTPIQNPMPDFEADLTFFMNSNEKGMDLGLDKKRINLDYYTLRSSFFIQFSILNLADRLIKNDQKEDAEKIILHLLTKILPYQAERYVLGTGEGIFHLLIQKLAQTESEQADAWTMKLFEIYQQNLLYFSKQKENLVMSSWADIFEAIQRMEQSYQDSTQEQKIKIKPLLVDSFEFAKKQIDQLIGEESMYISRELEQKINQYN